MLSLTKELEHFFIYKGKKYRINLAFDNVLRWYELLEDQNFLPEDKALMSFHIFFGKDAFNTDLIITSLKSISEYLQKRPYGKNVQPDDQKYYSLTQDAEAIYASFMKDYHIDLISMQGKLHWDKFIALLFGLSEDTYFKKIIDIRTRDISDLTGNAKQEMIDAKAFYELDENRTEEAHDSQSKGIFEALKAQAIKEGRVINSE